MRILNIPKVCKGMQVGGEIPTEKQVFERTLSIAWPSMLESFSINLAGFLDTIMVGSLGAKAIAAVGLATQPKFIVLAVFFALNVAVSAVVARRKGEENRESANRVLRMALWLTLIVTAVLCTLAFIFSGRIIQFVGSRPETHELAVDYFRIVLVGLVFTTIPMIINGAQRGVGNTRISLVTNLVSNGVNVIFNYLLIGGNFGFPALGVRGAAIATVIGSVCGCLLSIRSILSRDGFLHFSAAKGWIADRLSCQSIVKVGSSAFIEQLCIRTGFLLFAMTVANLGTIELSANQIGGSMMSMSFSFGDGLSVASVSLIGQSLGQKRPDLAKIYGAACQRIGLICAFAISLVYTVFGRKIFALFTTESEVLAYATPIMGILSVFLFFQIAQVVQFGCLRGAGDTKYTAMISLISVTVIRPGISFLLCYPAGLGLIGAWIGIGCDQIVRFTLSYLRFRKGDWAKLKL